MFWKALGEEKTDIDEHHSIAEEGLVGKSVQLCEDDVSEEGILYVRQHLLHHHKGLFSEVAALVREEVHQNREKNTDEVAFVVNLHEQVELTQEAHVDPPVNGLAGVEEEIDQKGPALLRVDEDEQLGEENDHFHLNQKDRLFGDHLLYQRNHDISDLLQIQHRNHSLQRL